MAAIAETRLTTTLTIIVNVGTPYSGINSDDKPYIPHASSESIFRPAPHKT
jgi:hypothetical protein